MSCRACGGESDPREAARVTVLRGACARRRPCRQRELRAVETGADALKARVPAAQWRPGVARSHRKVGLVNTYKRVKRGWSDARHRTFAENLAHTPTAKFVAGLPRTPPLRAGTQAGAETALFI